MANGPTRVKDAVARPLRGGLQGGAGWVTTEFIDAIIWNMNDRQYGVMVVALSMVYSFLQNFTENHFEKAILRDVPEQDPKVIDKGPGA